MSAMQNDSAKNNRNTDKRFGEWIDLKEGLHTTARTPKLKEGDIWWCSIGENIGVEINGKSKLFSRPVLVLKKLSRFGFLGVPLTSQPHEGSWYASFIFQNRRQVAVLAQVRTISVSRLHNRIGMIPDSDLGRVREAFSRLYSW